jgi:platelet-activating factor acetylhydrolase IB subunit alpha
LASCSNDLSIKIWNFDTLTCIKTITGHEHTVSFVEFSPDSTLLYSASRDKSIKVWDVSNGNCKKTLSDHSDWVRCLSVNVDGNLNYNYIT